MNQTTIDRLNAMIVQNNQMNHDLAEVLTLANEGWKQDTTLIESEIQKGKDVVAQQVTELEEENTRLKDEIARLKEVPNEEVTP